MLKSYLKVAFRNLSRSRILSFINIGGLSLGIACAVLIILFLKDELTFDSFHSKADQIYRPWTQANLRGRQSINSATPFIMGKQLFENYEEVEKYTVWTSYVDLVEIEDKSFSETINIASPQFFEIFDFKVIDGSVIGALDDPGNLIITRDMALKYFGRVNVTGNYIKIQIGGRFREFEVKAVLVNIPSNSSIQFGMIISDEHLKDIFPETMLTSWFMITGDNYLLLAKDSDSDQVASKFKSLVDQTLADQSREMDYKINLQPIRDIHLSTTVPAGNAPSSNPKYIYILGAIALLILSIACINFMTLSLGKSLSRTKEIGVRKSIGAYGSQLLFQFLGEALMISFISLIIGLFIAYIGLAWFNELAGKSLKFELSIYNLAIFLSLALVIGFISGIYPAWVMSRMKSAHIIKGNLALGTGKNRLRMILVGSQFVLSIFLISSTLIMKSQLRYLQNKNLGFDKENVIVVPLSISVGGDYREIVKNGFDKASLISPYIKSNANVASVGVASHTFEQGTWTQIGWMDENNEQYNFYYNTVDAGYIPALGMKIVAGRNFSDDNQSDFNRSIIVNESFVKTFNLDNPIGSRIPNNRFSDHQIIGVIKDFNIESLHAPIEPLVLSMNADIVFSGAQSLNIGSSEVPKLLIRIKPDRITDAILAVNKIWKQIYPEDPFDYSFIDENLKEQYQREKNLDNIVTSASIVAILIGCMGLFGLTSLTLISRTKEVSIRKVFGASRMSLLFTLSQSFALMIIISLVIASPGSYYFMDKWLSQFAYKINIGVGIYIFAGFLTLLVALLTISYQTIKVANTNPAQTLRSE